MLLIARTDAESAKLLSSTVDVLDHEFVKGVATPARALAEVIADAEAQVPVVGVHVPPLLRRPHDLHHRLQDAVVQVALFELAEQLRRVSTYSQPHNKRETVEGHAPAS